MKSDAPRFHSFLVRTSTGQLTPPAMRASKLKRPDTTMTPWVMGCRRTLGLLGGGAGLGPVTVVLERSWDERYAGLQQLGDPRLIPRSNYRALTTRDESGRQLRHYYRWGVGSLWVFMTAASPGPRLQLTIRFLVAGSFPFFFVTTINKKHKQHPWKLLVYLK